VDGAGDRGRRARRTRRFRRGGGVLGYDGRGGDDAIGKGEGRDGGVSEVSSVETRLGRIRVGFDGGSCAGRADMAGMHKDRLCNRCALDHMIDHHRTRSSTA
jgi:hypothetical protein